MDQSKASCACQSKFTEGNGGSCSQTRKKKSLHGPKLPQCNGLYLEQVNPINGVQSRCALTGKDVRYWNIIPELFDLDRDSNHSPCPFVGPWYQWMRNLVLCQEAARQEGLEPGFLVVYTDASALPFPNVLASDDWHSFTGLIKKDAPQLATLPYQKLLAGARQSYGGMWKDLETWVLTKIDKVLEGCT